MAIVAIESRALRVEVDADFGARVVSLLDRRSGRDWMAKGSQSSQVGEDAVYAADEAVGWDECFPTVAPWDASGTTHGRRLRDHGDLWGRPFTVEAQAPDSLTLSRTAGGFRFTRRLSADDAVLAADYRVDNIGDVALPYMWALHGLLAVTPEDRIELGVDTVSASYLSRDGKTIVAPQLAWPGPNRALDLKLDAVHPATTQFAGKLYASTVPGARAAVSGPRGAIDIAFDNAEIAHLGIWLNYGGWPAPGNGHHIALEPTTAPVDHLGQALEQGSATILAPGASASWTITMTLRAP